MRIATFNINSINGRLANLLRWLEVSSPDVACLQEIKCTNAAFPRKALEAAGYSAIWCGQGLPGDINPKSTSECWGLVVHRRALSRDAPEAATERPPFAFGCDG
jgi:mRNA deadenylase 3'-5' endonuclease subunit Ccr4